MLVSEKLKRAVIKEELVALTGDLEKAVILNQLIYWSERIRDFDKFIIEEKARTSQEGQEEVTIELQNGWIYKDMEELKDEVMFTCSISTMSRKLKELIDNEWISRRNNPRFKWDKRYQYRVNLNKIATDLHVLGYQLQSYKIVTSQLLSATNLQNESSNSKPPETAISPILHSATSWLQNESSDLQNESSDLQGASSDLHNDDALSEITTETTFDITSINHSQNLSTGGNQFNEIDPFDRMNEANTQNDFNIILNNSQYYDFEEKYSSALFQAIRLLYYSDKPLKINNMSMPPAQVREDLKRLTGRHLDFAIRDYTIVSQEQHINYPLGYLSKCIYNAIFQGSLKMDSDLRYHGLI